MVEATASVYLHLAGGTAADTVVIQAVNGREIRVPVRVLIFNLNVLLTFTATRFVRFLRANETNVLVAGPNVIGELLYLRVFPGERLLRYGQVRRHYCRRFCRNGKLEIQRFEIVTIYIYKMSNV